MTVDRTAGPTTKRDRIVQDLRAKILTNEIPRGARLRQDALAAELSASITPVREALRILEAEGLVVAEPHKGVRVAGIDLERIKGIYITRRLIESYAMRRATLRMSALDLKQARAVLDDTRAALDSGNPDAVRALNRSFHFQFYDRCGVPYLHDQIESMWNAFPWDLSLDAVDRSSSSLDEHRQILDAVVSGDLDRVAAATEAHIRSGFRSVMRRATGGDVADPFELESD